jgi:lactate dehydrogenase-like 2-hydroxyacid dehydrogenase
MDREAFSLLPRGAVFINLARDKLVDEDVLIDALKSGQLFSAGLEVFNPSRTRTFDSATCRMSS